jgi:hypothetical protein
METLEAIERKIVDRITDDLMKIDELAVIAKDPLGYSTYLHFLVKNGRRSAETDNLVDWMNSWVNNIAVNRNFSRFVDRELTSALFAYFSLKTFRFLRIEMENESLSQLFAKYVEDHSFFDSFTFSSIILLALSDLRNEIEGFEKVLDWVRSEADKKTVFNDAKNIVFISLLYEKLGMNDELKKLADYCQLRLHENNIPSYDGLYYAYVLWKSRGLRNPEEVRQITEFSNDAIMNARKFLREASDESVSEVYGTDAEAISTGSSVSKIFLGVYLDLAVNFGRDTIVVAKEELSRKDIPIWMRLGPIVSIIILSLNAPILWFSYSLRIVRKVTIDFSTATLYTFSGVLAQFLVNASIFVSVIMLLTVSLSLLYDIVVRGFATPSIVKSNLKSRLSRFLIWEIIIPLAITALETFFGIPPS